MSIKEVLDDCTQYVRNRAVTYCEKILMESESFEDASHKLAMTNRELRNKGFVGSAITIFVHKWLEEERYRKLAERKEE